jgi:hypothetical protein
MQLTAGATTRADDVSARVRGLRDARRISRCRCGFDRISSADRRLARQAAGHLSRTGQFAGSLSDSSRPNFKLRPAHKWPINRTTVNPAARDRGCGPMLRQPLSLASAYATACGPSSFSLAGGRIGIAEDGVATPHSAGSRPRSPCRASRKKIY